MSGEVNYALPSDMLAAIRFELDGAEPLYGLMTEISIRAHGIHQTFPYVTYSGSSYDTYSIVRAGPGSLDFSGLLMADEETIQGLLSPIASIDYGTATQLDLIVPSTLTVLASWDLWDYRLNAVRMSTIIIGNATVMRGSFSASFRKLADHV